MDFDPITEKMFSDDFQRFVLQNPNVNEIPHPTIDSQKPFILNPADKSEKSKKDADKQKEEKKQKPFT